MNLETMKNKRFYLLQKSILDVLFASIFLIIGFPIFMIISLLIKLSSRGKIFFSQERIGKDNRPFKCLKFRTMHPEADDILENLLERNEFLKKEFYLSKHYLFYIYLLNNLIFLTYFPCKN